MIGCAMLTCAMLLFQSGQENRSLHEEALGHRGSDDLTWVHTPPRPAPVHIEGPIWTRGVSLFRGSSASVWAVPGPSAQGTTVGLGMAVDF
jgi:hypothetical protein